MIQTRASFVLGALLLLGAPRFAAGSEGQATPTGALHLSLPEAIERGLAHDPKTKNALARVDEAAATRRSVRGNYGPRLQLDGSLFRWNSPHDLLAVDPKTIDLSGLPPEMLPMLQPLLTSIAKPIRFRDPWTSQLQVSLVQPLTQLYSIYHGHQAAQQGEHAAARQVEQSRREIVYRVTEAYYRQLMAEHLLGVAEESVTTLGAHLDQARQFREAEMLSLDDYLAVEVELGNAKENQIKAQAQLQMSQVVLATLVGGPEDGPFIIADIPEDVVPPGPPPLLEAQRYALQHRSEIAALRALQESNREQGKVAWWQLTPQISALARYQHTEGTTMNNEDEWFAGAIASWNVWDWGATSQRAQGVEAQTRQVRARVQEVEDLVRLDVTQRVLAIAAARERLEVARTSLRQAEEALRISRLKFEQRTVPSTAVLDAQTRLARAQANRINAQYELIIAVAALRLAMGEGVVASVLPEELSLASAKK